MVKQKRRIQKGAALALALLLLLTGCKRNRNLPFYQFERYPEAVLLVDGVAYIENIDLIWHKTHMAGLFWNFTGEIGDTIGICGGDNAERGGAFDVCTIEGDEARDFLYVRPNHFVFGPYYTFFCIREDLQIMLPSAETVSSVAIVYSENEENTSLQVDDPAMIAALFEALHGDSVQTRTGEDWVYGSFTMRHKDYDFLQCEIKFCCSPERETAYCQRNDGEWLPLPAEWAKRQQLLMRKAIITTRKVIFSGGFRPCPATRYFAAD